MRTRLDFGAALKQRRQQCRLSQLALATDARISTRHLSFIETGRSRPSRGMVLHLAELLSLPLRQRNEWLLAAGFSPEFPQHALDSAPMSAALAAVDLVLTAHGHLPAIAVDRHWNMLKANAAAGLFLQGVDASLLVPPINVIRLSLHPLGLASRILNLESVRAHILHRLIQQFRQTGDQGLMDLHEEVASYPTRPDDSAVLATSPDEHVVLPICLQTSQGMLRLFSTITVFGTPVEVTLAELAVEAFFPADNESAALLQMLASAVRPT